MSVRTAGAAALMLTVLAVAGCSSSGSTQSGSTQSGSTSTSTASSASGAAGASTLAGKISKGLSGLSSAHITLNASGLGISSGGDFTFTGGSATASDITLSESGDQIEVITTGGTSYAKLPAGQDTSGKPWVKVSADSKNEFVRGLASTLGLDQAVGSLDELTAIIGGADSVQDKGTTTVGGVTAHEYALTVSPSSGGSGQLQSLLSQLGSKSLPVQLWLDSSGRPVRVQLAVDVAGKSFPIVITISKYNAPVHISAPPASQVNSD